MAGWTTAGGLAVAGAAAAAAVLLLAHAKSWPLVYHVRLVAAMAVAAITVERLREDETIIATFRAGADDLDFNLHMNNRLGQGGARQAIGLGLGPWAGNTATRVRTVRTRAVG